MRRLMRADSEYFLMEYSKANLPSARRGKIIWRFSYKLSSMTNDPLCYAIMSKEGLASHLDNFISKALAENIWKFNPQLLVNAFQITFVTLNSASNNKKTTTQTKM